MKTINVTAVVLAMGLAWTTGAMAENMSKQDYRAGKTKIGAEYKLAKSGCTSMSGNANDICKAEAKGHDRVALAELEAAYKPSVKTHYKARVAKAESDYAVAREHCDDAAGNAKDVCVKEAKAAHVAAMADAKMQKTTSNANNEAAEKTTDARTKAVGEANDAGKDAAAQKRDAQYQVAKEKCDASVGSAKEQCLDLAKANFNKS